MKTTLHTLLFTLLLGIGLSAHLHAQDTPGQTIAIPVEGEQATNSRNTFIDYNTYITGSERFHFRRELRKVKQDVVFLEYATPNNQIRISKYDYLKLVRRAVNQSETKTQFMDRIGEHFVDPDQHFAQQADFESVYDATRPYTFHGYFDGLPKIW